MNPLPIPLPSSVWVAGCGFLGRALAASLSRQGVHVTALTHSPVSAQAIARDAPFPVHACDISSLPAIQNLAASAPAPPGAIIHCASSGRSGPPGYRSVYLDGCAHLLNTLPNSLLLFTSSTSVYPQSQGESVAESSPADPPRETGQILRATEELVLHRGGIVARLAGIYGPGRSILLQRFLEGSAIIESGTSRYLNQIHRDDIVTALLTLLKHRHLAAGQIYNVSDDHPFTQRSFYETLAPLLHAPLPPEAPPNLDRKRGWTHKQVVSAKLQSLGWRPLYPSFFDALHLDPGGSPPSILGNLP